MKRNQFEWFIYEEKHFLYFLFLNPYRFYGFPIICVRKNEEVQLVEILN